MPSGMSAERFTVLHEQYTIFNGRTATVPCRLLGSGLIPSHLFTAVPAIVRNHLSMRSQEKE